MKSMSDDDICIDVVDVVGGVVEWRHGRSVVVVVSMDMC